MVSEQRTILIVDDEPQLCGLMQVFLERSGYLVVAFNSATHALEFMRGNPQSAELAVVDLSLPDMEGDRAGIEMRKINPSLRVLICSGYPFEVESLPPEHHDAFAHLQKPFVPKMLIESVEQLLSR